MQPPLNTAVSNFKKQVILWVLYGVNTAVQLALQWACCGAQPCPELTPPGRPGVFA